MATADILQFGKKPDVCSNGLPLPDIGAFLIWVRQHHCKRDLQVSQLVALADEWVIMHGLETITERAIVNALSRASELDGSGVSKRRKHVERTSEVVAREAGRKARLRVMDHSDMVTLKDETTRIMQTVYTFADV